VVSDDLEMREYFLLLRGTDIRENHIPVIRLHMTLILRVDMRSRLEIILVAVLFGSVLQRLYR